jgi:predicted nucleic acid-binding protein
VILIDANVLVHVINRDSPQHDACRALVKAVQDGRLLCVLLPQILLEFYSVVTEAYLVEQPLPPEKALEIINSLQCIFPVMDPGSDALDCLAEVIADKPCIGGGVFDAWLVAQMKQLGVNRVCTYNPDDFLGIKGIQPVTPEDILDSLL